MNIVTQFVSSVFKKINSVNYILIIFVNILDLVNSLINFYIRCFIIYHLILMFNIFIKYMHSRTCLIFYQKSIFYASFFFLSCIILTGFLVLFYVIVLL